VFLATHTVRLTALGRKTMRTNKLHRDRDSAGAGKPQVPASARYGALRNRAIHLDFMERPPSRHHVPADWRWGL
jgi:hypothetical protein